MAVEKQQPPALLRLLISLSLSFPFSPSLGVQLRRTVNLRANSIAICN